MLFITSYLTACVYHGEGNVICTSELTVAMYNEKTVCETDVHFSTVSLHTVNDIVNVDEVKSAIVVVTPWVSLFCLFQPSVACFHT